MKRIITWIVLAVLIAAIALTAKMNTDMNWTEIIIGIPMATLIYLSDDPGGQGR